LPISLSSLFFVLFLSSWSGWFRPFFKFKACCPATTIPTLFRNTDRSAGTPHPFFGSYFAQVSPFPPFEPLRRPPFFDSPWRSPLPVFSLPTPCPNFAPLDPSYALLFPSFFLLLFSPPPPLPLSSLKRPFYPYPYVLNRPTNVAFIGQNFPSPLSSSRLHRVFSETFFIFLSFLNFVLGHGRPRRSRSICPPPPPPPPIRQRRAHIPVLVFPSPFDSSPGLFRPYAPFPDGQPAGVIPARVLFYPPTISGAWPAFPQKKRSQHIYPGKFRGPTRPFPSFANMVLL